MKFLLFGLMLTSSVIAYEKPASLDKEIIKTNPSNMVKEEILEKLFTSLGQTEFITAYVNAQRAGLHPQVLLEARFLNLVDLGDHSAIANLAPELIKSQLSFNPNHSEVFVIKDDWAAIVHYAQALAALEKNDTQAFKRHITEAFWLSPRQAQAYGPHVEKLRLEEAMRSIQLPLQQTLLSQEGQTLTSLAEHNDGNKAIVLYFWNPMSQANQVELPDFITTTQACAENNISVHAILTGNYPSMLDDAEIIRKNDATEAKCTWLVDPNKNSLSSLLWVRSLPTVIVASTDGQVLFNGHPSDESFWRALEDQSPRFERPNSIEK